MSKLQMLRDIPGDWEVLAESPDSVVVKVRDEDPGNPRDDFPYGVLVNLGSRTRHVQPDGRKGEEVADFVESVLRGDYEDEYPGKKGWDLVKAALAGEYQATNIYPVYAEEHGLVRYFLAHEPLDLAGRWDTGMFGVMFTTPDDGPADGEEAYGAMSLWLEEYNHWANGNAWLLELHPVEDGIVAGTPEHVIGGFYGDCTLEDAKEHFPGMFEEVD